MRKRQDAAQYGPKGRLPGPISRQRFPALLKPALGLRAEGNSMPGDEFEQPHDYGWIGLQLGRHTQKNALVRDGEVRIRQARSPVAELNQQRAFILFD